MDEESIFAASLAEKTPAQRVAFLDQACAGDAVLRSRVEALLRAHDNPDSFLEAPDSHGLGTVDGPLREGPGTVIGPYKLLEVIGEGGFGIVFMAEQQKPLRRRVALKVLKPGMDTRQVIARFEAERQALALMDHPNIAHVHDGGETAGGRPYFVMELVKGTPITAYCDQAQLAPRQRLELFITVCQAVQHAHQKGIIHRDLKPSNVLVALHDGTPVVKVIDFGIAKATAAPLTDKTLFTGFAQMIGTPMYMSPEQAGQSSLDVDTRSDIYALGVLLYELLTGTTPFDKERLKEASYEEIRRIIREEEPARPSTRLSTLDAAAATVSANRQSDPKRLSQLIRGELDWIVMKALEKDRCRRYETANALAADVQRYLNDEPVQAFPPSAWYRFRKFARRNKTALAITGLIALLLVTLVGGLVVNNRLIREEQALTADERDRALRAEKVATANQEKAQAAERGKAEKLWKAKLAQAQAGRWSGRAGRAFDSLQALAEAAQIARSLGVSQAEILTLRNEAIACMALTDLKIRQEYDRYTAEATGGILDSGLERYATCDGKGNIAIRRVPDDQQIVRLKGPGVGWSTRLVEFSSGRSSACFSPHGRYLAAIFPLDDKSERGRISIWDLAGGKSALQLAPEFPRPVLHWSPDGRRFGFLGQPGTVALYDMGLRKEIQRFRVRAGTQQIAFHPHGKQLAAKANAAVQICDFDTGKIVDDFAFPEPIDRLSWGGAGRFLASSCPYTSASPLENIYVWDVRARRMYNVMKGHVNAVIDVAFNHRGDILASTSWDGTVRLWNPWTGKELVRAQEGVWGGLEFSPDDRFLSVRKGWSDTRLCWEVRSGPEDRTLYIPSGEFGGTISFSPDGHLLASSGTDGVWLWDLAALKDPTLLPAGHVGPVMFTRDGKSLLTAGPAGFYRWPLLLQPDKGAHKLRIGPPAKLVLETPRALTRDERTLAAAHQGRTLSPDGKWAATGSWHASGARVWDTKSGQLVRHLTTDDASVGFSPDGRWLVTGSEKEYLLWRVGSWKPGPRIARKQGYVNGVMAFTPDATLLAIANSKWDIQLIDPTTGRQVATLPNSDSQSISSLAFGPEGSKLAVVASPMTGVSGGAIEIHLLDLRAIRGQLAAMGLDWELPPYASADPRFDAKPIRVEVQPARSASR